MRKWARRIWILVLVGCMALGGWDCARGRSQRAVTDRAEAAFLDRSWWGGCEAPRRITFGADDRWPSASGGRFPLGTTVAQRLEQRLNDKLDGWVEPVDVRVAGRVEAIVFERGGPTCQANLFVPVRIAIDVGAGFSVELPTVVRIDGPRGVWSRAPVVFPELVGLRDFE